MNERVSANHAEPVSSTDQQNFNHHSNQLKKKTIYILNFTRDYFT
jgi:hypothetical protein